MIKVGDKIIIDTLRFVSHGVDAGHIGHVVAVGEDTFTAKFTNAQLELWHKDEDNLFRRFRVYGHDTKIEAEFPEDEPRITEPNAKAFPSTAPLSSERQEPGLTKREYFASLAMQGILAKIEWPTPDERSEIARRAVSFADLLITELNKAKGEKW